MDIPQRIDATLDPQVPTDERYDIQSELFKDFLSELSIVPAEEIRDLKGYLGGYQDTGLSKAIEPYRSGPFPITHGKNKKGHKSHLFIDELGIISGGATQHWVEKLSPFGFAALKTMVENTPILNAIIMTRIRQVKAFARPYRSHDEHPMGFCIVPEDHKIGDKLSDEQEKAAKYIKKFLLNCGDEEDPRKRKWVKQRDNLLGFMGKMVRDTLSMDACPIETEVSSNGRNLSGLYNIPAETVRIAHEEGYLGSDQVVAVQIFNDQVIAFYTPDDLIYEVRNPRSDINASRYGYGETEMIVRLVTSFLNTVTYNSAYFDRNNLPRGIFTLFGNFDQTQLNFFKRSWNAMLNGPAQRWRVPFMVSKDSREAGAKFERIDADVKDMYFAKWMSFLVSLVCAQYGMPPEKISFDSFSSRASSLSGDDTATKLGDDTDKGKEPLLNWLEGTFNEFIIPRIVKGYVIQFVGLHREDQEHLWDAKMKAWTYDELRKSLGDEPFDDPTLGNAPLDPGLQGIYSQQLPQNQMGEEDEHGLPQDVIDRLKENKAGEDQQGQEMQQPNEKIQPGQEEGNLAQEGREVKKAQKKFVVYTDIRQESGGVNG